MEDIAGGNTAELQKSCNSTNTDGHSTLKKFTIPRKKRNLEKALLEECPKESREYSYIHSTLNDSRLDITYEIFPPWECQDVKLVHNEDLAREFSEKRFEMRSKGRHGREMEERFCFLVTSIKGAAQLYENGVKTCKTGPYTLGNPLYGVYLFRHVDVALKRAMKKSTAPKTIVIFKALFGKVKRVKSCMGKMVDQDPTIHFDCFMSKDPISPKDTLSQQVLGSFVFLFDFNEKQELCSRPRQCLPCAVVSVIPCDSVPIVTCTPLSKLSALGLPHGSVEPWKRCTVAERRGRGENTTIIFKHYGTTEHNVVWPDYNSPGSSSSSSLPGTNQAKNPKNAESYRGQKSGIGNVQVSCNENSTDQQWALSYFSSGSMPSFSYINEAQTDINWTSEALSSFTEGKVDLGKPMSVLSPPSKDVEIEQSYPGRHYLTASPGDPVYNRTDKYQNTFNLQMMSESATQPSCELSTTVITSRVVKDPRLNGREKDSLKRKINEEPGLEPHLRKLCVYPTSQSHTETVSENDLYSPNVQVPENKHPSRKKPHAKAIAGHDIQNSIMRMNKGVGASWVTHPKGPFLHAPSTHNKQDLPIDLLKMKFQKYSLYLLMTEKERIAKVHSLKNVPLEEKELLLRRIRFYEKYFKRYGKHLLHQEDSSVVRDIHRAPRVPCGQSLYSKGTSTERCSVQQVKAEADGQKVSKMISDGQQKLSLGNMSQSTKDFPEKTVVVPDKSRPDLSVNAEVDLKETCIKGNYKPLLNIGGADSQVNVTNKIPGGDSISTLKESELDTEQHCSTSGNQVTESAEVPPECQSAAVGQSLHLPDELQVGRTLDHTKENLNHYEAGYNFDLTLETSSSLDHTHLQKSITVKTCKGSCENPIEATTSSAETMDVEHFYFLCEHQQDSAGKLEGSELRSEEAVRSEQESANAEEYCTNVLCISHYEEVSYGDVSDNGEAIECDLFSQNHLQHKTAQLEAGNMRHTSSTHVKKMDGGCDTQASHTTGNEGEDSPCNYEFEEAERECCETHAIKDGVSSSDKVYWFLHRRIQFGQMISTASRPHAIKTASNAGSLKDISNHSSLFEDMTEMKHEVSRATKKPNFQITIKSDARDSCITSPQLCKLLFFKKPSYNETEHKRIKQTMSSSAFDGVLSNGTVSFCAQQPENTCISSPTKDNGYVPKDPVFSNCKEQKTVSYDTSFSKTKIEGYIGHISEISQSDLPQKQRDIATDFKPFHEGTDISDSEPSHLLKNHTEMKMTLQGKIGFSSHRMVHKCLSDNSGEQFELENKIKAFEQNTSILLNSICVQSHANCFDLGADVDVRCDHSTAAEDSSHNLLIPATSQSKSPEGKQSAGQIVGIGMTSYFNINSNAGKKSKISTVFKSNQARLFRKHTGFSTLYQRKNLRKTFIKAPGGLNRISKSATQPTVLISKVGVKRIQMSRKKNSKVNVWRAQHLNNLMNLKVIKSQTAVARKKIQMKKCQYANNNQEEAHISCSFNPSASKEEESNLLQNVCDEEQNWEEKLLVTKDIKGPGSTHVSNLPFTAPVPNEDYLNTPQVEDSAKTQECQSKKVWGSTELCGSIFQSSPSPFRSIMTENEKSLSCAFPITAEKPMPVDIHVTETEEVARPNISIFHAQETLSAGENMDYLLKIHSEPCVNPLENAVSLCTSGAEVVTDIDSWEPSKLENENTDMVIPALPKDKEKLELLKENTGMDSMTSHVGQTAGNENSEFKHFSQGAESSIEFTTGSHRREKSKKDKEDVKKTNSTCISVSSGKWKPKHHLQNKNAPEADDDRGKSLYNVHQTSSFAAKLTEIFNVTLNYSNTDERDIDTGSHQTGKCSRLLYQTENHSPNDFAKTVDTLYSSKGKDPNQLRTILNEKQNCRRGTRKDFEVTTSAEQVNQHFTQQLPEADKQKDRHQTKSPAILPDIKIQMESYSYNLFRVASGNVWYPCKDEMRDSFTLIKQTETVKNHHEIEPSHSKMDLFYTTLKIDYSVKDISNTLKEADAALLLDQLYPLRSKCREMLASFVSAFERDQCVNFKEAFISKDLIMEKNLKGLAAPIKLKYRALNSFLELQMMMEAVQFVENKISFLNGSPTFRSLLWYDPSLYSELKKGKNGFQQQSSLYPQFQECLAQYGYSELRKHHSYFSSPTCLHTKETSYYLFLKNRRERAESLAAVHNYSDYGSFFFSVPLSCGINFGNSIEDLQLLLRNICSFMQILPKEVLCDSFDFAKVVHLSIIRRLVCEKINFLMSNKDINSKASWFGFEHILFDAAKTLVWKDLKGQESGRIQYTGVKQRTVLQVNNIAVRHQQKLYDKIVSDCVAATSGSKPRANQHSCLMNGKQEAVQSKDTYSADYLAKKDSMPDNERKELKTTVSRQQLPVTLPSGHIEDNEVMTCPLAVMEIQDTSLQLKTTALRNGHDSLQLQPHVQALSEPILETIYKSQNGSEQQIKKKAKSLEPCPHTLASEQGMMCDVNCTPKTKVSSSDFVPVERVFEQQRTAWAPWHNNHSSSLQRTLPCPVSQAQQRECHRYQQQPRPAWGKTKTLTCISNKSHFERNPGSGGLLRPSIPVFLQNSQQQTLYGQAPHYWNQPVLPFWSLHQGGGAWTQQLHSAPVCSGRQELQPAGTYHAFASTTDHGSQFHHLQALNNSCPYYNWEPFLFCNGYPFGMSNSQIPAVDSQHLRTFYSDPNCSAASQPPPVYWN